MQGSGVEGYFVRPRRAGRRGGVSFFFDIAGGSRPTLVDDSLNMTGYHLHLRSQKLVRYTASPICDLSGGMQPEVRITR